jgi:branched-chain amino acid transport system substrate-binding protein
VLVCGITPRFAAQAIRRVARHRLEADVLHDQRVHLRRVVMQPAGAEKGIGVITSDSRKDQSDPAWANDPGMNEWRDFMRRYVPDGELSDNNYTYAYGVGTTMIHVLRECGNDLSRENVMRQAANISALEAATLLPGIKVSTSPTNFSPIRQMQLQRWDGRSWQRFGNVIEGAQV